jgi:hypothetical protein
MEKIEKSIVILILSTKKNSYNDFKKAIRNTWLADFKKMGARCFFYEGDSETEYMDTDTIYLTCGDELNSCAQKAREAINFVTNNFDNVNLIYRTNLSSYIDTDIFFDYVSKIRDKNTVYQGVVGTAKLIPEYFHSNENIKDLLLCLKIGPKIDFCSGSGVFIGKEYFPSIIHTRTFDRFVDDLMFRLCIGKNPENNFLVDRFDFTSNFDPRCSTVEFSNRLKTGLFHYRFKTDNRAIDSKLLELFGDVSFREKFCIKE